MSSWSYSSLENYETCPRKFYETRVARNIVEPPSEAIKWGEKVHTAFEERVRDGKPLPDGMRQWEPIAGKIVALPGEKSCEVKFSISKEFQPVAWRDGWSRGKADLLVKKHGVVAALDYKTGKKKPTEQLLLYAAYVFAHFPEVHTVHTGFVWLQERNVSKDTYQRDELPALWQKLLPRVRKLEDAYERSSWPARPNGLCKEWCPVLRCEHNGRRSKGG